MRFKLCLGNQAKIAERKLNLAKKLCAARMISEATTANIQFFEAVDQRCPLYRVKGSEVGVDSVWVRPYYEAPCIRERNVKVRKVIGLQNIK